VRIINYAYSWVTRGVKCSQAYCQQDLSAFLTTNFVITLKIVIYCTAVWQY